MVPAATNEALANRIGKSIQELQNLIHELGCPQLQDDAFPLLNALKADVKALTGIVPGSRLTPPPSPERTPQTKPTPPPRVVEPYTKISSKLPVDEFKKHLGIGEKWEDARVSLVNADKNRMMLNQRFPSFWIRQRRR
jgi:hypothetical protein